MVFKKYWSNLHKKPFNTMVDNSINCVGFPVNGCRLDNVLKPLDTTNRQFQHFFSKKYRNAKNVVVYSFNWYLMVSKCILTGPAAL